MLPSWLVHYWHLTHPGKSVWFYVCLQSNEYFAESTPCQESRWFIGPCERGEWGHTKPLLKNHHEQSEPWKLPLSLSIPLTGAHIFAPQKNYFWQDVSLSPYTFLWYTHFCQKKTPFWRVSLPPPYPLYWCTHSWQNNHHFSSLGSYHEGVLQMALAIHLLHFPTFLNLILSGVSSSQGWNILVLLLLQSRSWSPNHHQRSLGGRG